MAQVDTSSYPQPQQGQNPLQSLQSLVGIQGQAISNQQNVLQMRAQQAIGQATQGATNPDGSVDYNRFMGLVRGNPDAAYEAAAAAQVAQAQKVSQVQLAMQKQDRLNTVLGSTLAAATKQDGTFDEARLTPETISGSVAELVNEGVLDAKTAASELGAMPTDPSQRYAWLKGHMAQGMDASKQLESIYGQLITVNNGQQMTSQRVSPYGGNMAPVQMQMSPGEQASPVPAVDAQGNPIAITKGQFAQKGSVQTGLSPSRAAAQTVTGQQNAGQAMQLQTEANQVNNVKAILGNMAGDLKYFNTGAGAGEWKKLLSAGVALGLPVNQNAVASQENFNKFAVQLAQRTGQMFGGNGSDERFLASVEANPNQQLTPEGNRRIINILKGNADATAAANKAWQAWSSQGHGGETFGQFMQQYNTKLDPRMFQMQYMNGQEQKQMLSGMSPQEQDQFEARMKNAVSKGWLPDPRKK